MRGGIIKKNTIGKPTRRGEKRKKKTRSGRGGVEKLPVGGTGLSKGPGQLGEKNFFSQDLKEPRKKKGPVLMGGKKKTGLWGGLTGRRKPSGLVQGWTLLIN